MILGDVIQSCRTGLFVSFSDAISYYCFDQRFSTIGPKMEICDKAQSRYSLPCSGTLNQSRSHSRSTLDRF
jgi:hypothetical protein